MRIISDFVKRNYKKFYFSIGINFILLLIFNLLFYSRFHTVDDVFIEMIVCGAFGKPDPHLVFVNVLLGYPLSFLYSIADFIPWYGLMHVLMALFSLSAITYVFFNRENKTAIIFTLAAIIITSYEAYTKIQFTKTAAYLATAGYILIAYSLEIQERKRIQLFGVIFILLSFLVRRDMFLGASAICLGFLLPKFFSYLRNLKDPEQKNNLYSLIKVGICCLFLVSSAFLIDHLAYKSEGWSYYNLYNERRGQLYDVVFPPYEDYEEEYQKLGFSNDDYLLYLSGDMNDPDLFGIETMEKIIEFQPNKVINLDEFVMFALRGYNTLFRQKTLAPFTLLALILLFNFVFGCKFNIHKWLGLIVAGLMALIMFEFTYYMHGWFDRTTISVMFTLIIVEIYLSEYRQSKVQFVISIISLIIICLLSPVMWSEYLRWNRQEWKDEYDLNHEVIDEIYKDKDHIYISRVSFPMWKLFYTTYDTIRKGAMGNYATYGDWMINAPFYIEDMKTYDVVNPYKDLVDNDKAYLIGYLDNLDPIIRYIQRHYSEKAEPVLVRSLGPYGVYSIKSLSN